MGGLGIEALPDDVLRPDPVTGALLIGLSIPYINPIILNPKPQTEEYTPAASKLQAGCGSLTRASVMCLRLY